jgi:Putative Actinobacterial Holin-X, holin superfamily III
MTNNVDGTAEPRVTTLVNGMVQDAQALCQQHIALFKHEVRETLRETKAAAVSLSVGAGLCIAGGFLLCFFVVHLLNFLVPALPLWACFGIVAALLLLGGGALLYLARQKLQLVSRFPEQSVAAFKENVQWIMKRS